LLPDCLAIRSLLDSPNSATAIDGGPGRKLLTNMKLILTSDLHQHIEKWSELVAAIRRDKPRFVLIAGDLLPKVEPIKQQGDFFPEMSRCFQAMKQIGPVTILTYLGNDDAHIFEPRLDDLAAKGLCVNLNGRIHREEGLVFCGMNKVRDYPFGYKHWCARDGSYIACPQQFCGEGLEIDEHGNFIPLASLVAYLSAKPSIGGELDRLIAELQPGEMARSVWMLHQPPSGLGMDICGSGQRVGSPTVLKLIQDHQPLLGCSGHIHESPHRPGGRWRAQVGRTVWVQPGQIGHRLHYACVELGDDLEVMGGRHSIF
jgi:Icc-related predicted phosphoesterase